MRGHKPPTPVQQVAPSASELQCWGSENLGVLPIAGAADTLTERKQCHRIYYCRSQKWGGGWYSEPAERPSSVPGHKEETENRVVRPYYKVGEEITSFFLCSTLSGYCARCPRNSKVGTGGGNLIVQTLGVSRVSFCKMLRQQLNTAGFSSHSTGALCFQTWSGWAALPLSLLGGCPFFLFIHSIHHVFYSCLVPGPG